MQHCSIIKSRQFYNISAT